MRGTGTQQAASGPAGRALRLRPSATVPTAPTDTTKTQQSLRWPVSKAALRRAELLLLGAHLAVVPLAGHELDI